MSAGYVIYSLDWKRFKDLVQDPTPKQLRSLARSLREGLAEADELDRADPMSKWPTSSKALAPIIAQRLALTDWYGDLSNMGKELWEGMIVDYCMNGDDRDDEDGESDLDFRVDSDGVYWDVIELIWKHHRVVPNVISSVAISGFGTKPYRYSPPSKPQMTREEYDAGQGTRDDILSAMREALDEFSSKDVDHKVPPPKKQKKHGLEDILAPLRDEKKLSKGLEKAMDEFTKTSGFQKLEKLAEEHGIEEDDDGMDEHTPMHSMHSPSEVRQMLDEVREAKVTVQASKNRDAIRDYKEELLPALEKIVEDGRMLFIQVDT